VSRGPGSLQHPVRALEDPWRRVESRENLIYLVFCDILCGCPRGDAGGAGRARQGVCGRRL